MVGGGGWGGGGGGGGGVGGGWGGGGALQTIVHRGVQLNNGIAHSTAKLLSCEPVKVAA